MNYDDPSTVQFRLGGLVRQLSVPEFDAALGLYMEEFKEKNELHAFTRYIHFSPSKHVINLAYFIALAIQHQRERIRKGEEAYEDIPDDVPLQHKDPPTQPPPPSRPVHAAASYAKISERLTRFEQHCFQRFDNIDATLQ
ncbi:hypothetical protein PVK06_026739 [Gossypium arboreum]|uniref:Uncharacterized protein n=1 Tax=Gossypium arboreum TaxID=29729 RepID=A0ABR0NYH3_GOSAR|nr:hypothetical protein PVK06_026739 [Gossypium arboreum]